MLTAVEGGMSDIGSAKTHAREIIDQLPESASWDDVMYELYVREAIDAGLADVAAGRTIPHEQVRARLLELVRRAS
jgi:predicted transcriptional regulator